MPFRLRPDEVVSLKSVAESEGVSVAAWVALEMRKALRRAKGRADRHEVRAVASGPAMVTPPTMPERAAPLAMESKSPAAPGLGSAENPYGLCPCLSGRKWKFCGKEGRCS